MADGGALPEWTQGLNDEQLKSIGIERPAPAPAVTAPAPEAPLAINSIPGDPGSTVDQLRSNWKKIDDASGYKNGGCVKKMMAGGDVDGPGTGTSDSVPAMLSDGEYVLPADTVDAVGKATLDKLKAATHTPVHKPQARGMVVHLADGGSSEQPKYSDQQWALARKFYPNTTDPAASIENARRDDPAALQRAAGEIGNPPTPLQQSSALRFFDPTRVVSSGLTQNLPVMAAAPALAAPAPTQTPVVPAPVAAQPITAPNFMPTMTGPNTAQDMVSEGRNLMNTQGIGGFVQAKGLNRMAQTVNQTNEPLVRGQYELQNTAMTANERLEQAKLAEHQRQQNQETWTPDKNTVGELQGYGRTKGGVPQYVTKESLMAKPTLAQYIARNSLASPKATTAEHTAQYNARYGQ
jgi:hypothetical protein